MKENYDIELNKRNYLKLYLMELAKAELTVELKLDVVSLSRSNPYLASIGVTNFVNVVLPKSITTDELLWALYVKKEREVPIHL